MCIAVIALAACATPPSTPVSSTPTVTSAPATPTATQTYVATITALNNSGVSGMATVTVTGATLSVEVSAAGLTPGQTHPLHIHGLSSGASTCPPSPANRAVVPEASAERFYGPVLLPLEPFPAADATGHAFYSASLNASSAVPTTPLLPLDGRAIVVHGMMLGGAYNAGLPVGCGELTATTSASPTSAPPGATSGTPGY
jgi:Cu/Zn superoxide dismutase